MSFGESAVDEECAVDGEQDAASILAACNVPTVCNPNDPNVVNPTTVDPEMIGALMFRRSAMDPRSPTSVRCNEQVAVDASIHFRQTLFAMRCALV